MTTPTIFTPVQIAKFLKKTAKLSPKEAATELKVSVQTVYNWRKKATTTTATTTTPEVKLKAVKTTKPTKAKKATATPKVNVKKLIKAVDSMKTQLSVVEAFLKTVQAA